MMPVALTALTLVHGPPLALIGLVGSKYLDMDVEYEWIQWTPVHLSHQ